MIGQEHDHNHLIVHKIAAADAADVARYLNVKSSRTRYHLGWSKQFVLSVSPKRAREMHVEAQPEDIYKCAAFCSIYSPKYWSILIKILAERLIASVKALLDKA